MKVLCAVDSSEFSRWAVEALGALDGRQLDKIVLLHVAETGAIGPAPAKERARAAATGEGNKLLQRMAQAASLALGEAVTAFRADIRTVLVQGPAAETIVKQARRRRADLVIVGARGVSDIRGFLLGSTSRKVVALASSPVLVVKRRFTEMARVVLAVDGSKQSRAAAEFLRAKLLRESVRLTVLSAVAPVVTDIAAEALTPAQLERLTKPAEERARQLVAEFREIFLKEGCAVTTDVLAGHPSRTILQYAEKVKADLLVVGSRGLTGTDRLMLGSVSESLVKYAPCSVLVVRGGHG